MKAISCLLVAGLVLAQPAFEVASVKRSATLKGVDGRGHVTVTGNRVSAKNVTLKALIAAAYRVQVRQVTSELGWLDKDEFDFEAKAADSAQHGDVPAMLKGLITERFKLKLEEQEKEMKVQALLVDQGGPRLEGKAGALHFHGDMRQLADLLGVQATIPAPLDSSTPVIASAAPLFVVDRTGLPGVYDFHVDLKPEIGTDQFTIWKRALKEQLGLKLESQNARVPILVITDATRIPEEN